MRSVEGERNLTNPVRGELEMSHVRENWKPLSAPAREIRDDDVLAEMELRLDENPPPSRSSAAFIERRTQPSVEPPGGPCVAKAWPG